MKISHWKYWVLVAGLLAWTHPAGAQEAEQPELLLPLWTNATAAESAPAAAATSSLSTPMAMEVSSAVQVSISDDIAELAKGLENDPLRIFNHVRNHISYDHYYGSRKGAHATLLEGSGNDVDQCQLLAALLVAAGIDPAKISYVRQRQVIPYYSASGNDLISWWNLAGEPHPGKTFLEAYGENMPRPELGDLNAKRVRWASIFSKNIRAFDAQEDHSSGSISLTRMLLQVDIYSQDEGSERTYLLDPSFKRVLRKNGTSLLSMMGLTGEDKQQTLRDQLSQVAGGEVGADWVKSLNASAIYAKLAEYSALLDSSIYEGHFAKDLTDLIGGTIPIHEGVASLSDACPLPAPLAQREAPIQAVPASMRSRIEISIPATAGVTSKTLLDGFTDELQGRRLSLVSSGNNIRLWMEDEIVEATTSTAEATTYNVHVSIAHPGYDAVEETKRYRKNDTYAYALIYGFNCSGKQLAERYEHLQRYKAQGKADSSREVRTELLNIMGLTWLYQAELTAKALGNLHGELHLTHSRFGRMGQESGFYVDVGSQLFSSPSADGAAQVGNGSFFTGGLVTSAMEHGIIEQMQEGAAAVSTVDAIRKANLLNKRLYQVNAANWDQETVVTPSKYPALTGYDADTISRIQRRIAAPFNATLLITEQGNMSEGNWTGTGYAVRGDSIAGMEINGFGGGISVTSSYVSSPFVAVNSVTNPVYAQSSSAIPLVPVIPPCYQLPISYGSDPVNMATGAFVYSNDDLQTGLYPAPEGLHFSRQYNSDGRNRNGQNLGYGWTHNLHIRAVERTALEEALGLGHARQCTATLVALIAADCLYRENGSAKEWAIAAHVAGWMVDQMTNNAVSVTLGNQTVQFVKKAGGGFVSPAGSDLTLAKVDSVYELRQRHGSTIRFDGEGKAATIKDAYGRTLGFVYNSNDTLQYVQDSNGRRYTFTYASGRITKVVDSSDSRFVEFRYDADGNLDRFTDPEGKYSYFDYKLPEDAAEEAQMHRIRRLRNHDDQIITANFYDSLGRVREQWLHGASGKAFKLRYAGYCNSEENPKGGVIRYNYDERGRTQAIDNASGSTSRWTYDGQDRVVTHTTGSGESSVYTYDKQHNLLQIDHPRGGGSTFHVYDSLGRLERSTDPEARTVQYIYYASGLHSDKNAPWKIIDGAGTTTLVYYDAPLPMAGKLWKSTDEDGLATEFAYDTRGHPDWEKAPGGFKTDYQYSARGDLEYEDNPNLVRTRYLYNKRRQTTQIDHAGLITDYGYNNQGLPSVIKAPPHYSGGTSGSPRAETQLFYSPTEKLTTTTVLTWRYQHRTTGDLVEQYRLEEANAYDERDWLEKITNGSGLETHFEYRPDGARRKTIAPLAREVTAEYDADGRPTSSTLPGSPSPRTSGLGYVLTDAGSGDQTSGYPKTVATDPDDRSTFIEEDRTGRLRFYRNKTGRVFETRYDGLGRVNRIINPRDRAAGRSYQLTYYHRGAPKLVTEPSGQTETSHYDPLSGRLTSIDYAGGGSTETVAYSDYDANGNVKTVTEGNAVTRRTFTAWDQVKTYTDANGKTLTFNYNPNGSLRSIVYPDGVGTVSYTYWTDGRLKEVYDNLLGALRYSSYQWRDDGRLDRILRGNRSVRQINYDAAGRPELIQETAPDGGLIAAFKVGYHPSDDVDWIYTLPRPKATSVPEAWRADMTYADDNSLETFGGAAVDVDSDGNMTRGPLPGGVWGDYAYNSRNWLTSAGGASYRYDGEGTRLGYSSPGRTVSQTSDVDHGVAKLLMRTVNGQTTYYVWGAGLLHEVRQDGTATYYHYDQVGSTVALSDADARVFERIEYEPYGAQIYRKNTENAGGAFHDTPFLFTGFFGNETDPNGLIYMRARYYNPLTRRFLNSDPAREGWNWYAYAGGNPLAFVDPTGLGIESALDSVQTALSYLGLLPVVGEAFDVVNAGISLARGNYVDAAINLASALPGLGNAIGGAKVATASAGLVFAVAKVEKATPQFLYRGVAAGTTKYADALQGIARPRGTALDAESLRKHIMNEDVMSGVTSWTTDPKIAASFAGSSGIILKVPLARVSSQVIPRPSIGKYGHESEMLLRGIVSTR